jgi:ribosomal-protein-alanine N-acetyltransferase
MKIETDRLDIVPLCLNELRAIVESKVDFQKISTCKISGIELPATYCEELAEMMDANPDVWNPNKIEYLFFTLWVIVERKTRVFVGQFTFNGIPTHEGEVEVFFSIEPSFRRKGYATEVMKGIFKWVEQANPFKIMLIEADFENKAAMASLKKLGFKPVPTDNDEEEIKNAPTKYYKKISSLSSIKPEDLDFDE